MPQQYRRRNYFIDKAFQTKFVLIFCAIVVISSLFVIGLLLISLQDPTTVAIENTKVIVKRTSDFILPITVQTVTVVSLFSALAVIVLSILTSHKISGPLFRLIKEVDRVNEGDLNVDFRIRGNDQLQNLAKGLREMVESIKNNHKEVREQFDKLKKNIDEQAFSFPLDEREKLNKLLQELEDKLSKYKC